jgi:HAD superfamily hydrolase (TIGR01490 family)
MRLALFDLDGTLIPGDSDHAFCEFLIALGWADETEFHRRNDEFFRQYQAGRLDIASYIEFATAPWRTRPAAEQQAAMQRFMAEVMQPQIRPAALDLVQAHQQQGDLVAIVTATNEFITRPIADRFGVEHLIAVRLARDAQGAVTGRIDGTPSFREGKNQRLDDWLHGLGHRFGDFEQTLFYSDSTNDLPLLERVSVPVATNPGAALEAIAIERGWRILRLFE